MNRRGISMIEVLFCMSLLTISSLAVSQIVGNFNRSLTSVEEKLSIMELQKSLATIYSGQNLCQKDILAFPGNFEFPKANLNTVVVNVDSLFLNPTDILPILKTGKSISSGLFPLAKRVYIKNIKAAGGSYIADLGVDFETKTVSRKSISTSIEIALTDGATNTQFKITGCSIPTISDHGGKNDAGNSPFDFDKDSCLAAGGNWIVPVDPSRSSFCELPNSTIVWY